MTIETEIALTAAGLIFNAGIFVGGFYALKSKVEYISANFKENIARIEKKLDESNEVKERTTITEENIKAIWVRIDELRGWKK
jgi:hypothetical protein